MRCPLALLPALAAALVGCAGHDDENGPEGPAEPAPRVDAPVALPTPPPPRERPRVRCFEPAQQFPLPFAPLTGAWGDVDGDGNGDVIAVSFTTQAAIAIALGDGAGGFGDARTVEAPPRALGVVPGDFDGDGRLDLVSAETGEGTITFLRGDGSGGFSRAAGQPVHKWVGRGAAEDLDGDGRLDLVVPLWSAMRVLLGDGEGGFRPGQTRPTGQAPERPLLVDLDGDGRRDLAVPSNDAGRLSILARGPGATFGREVPVACGEGATQVAAGDLDLDGQIDLALANMHSDDVCVLRGKGRGVFEVARRIPSAGEVAVAIADIDGAGGPEILIPDHGRFEVWRHEASFEFSELTAEPIESGVRELWAEDVDRDRRVDAVLLSMQSPAISVLLGRPCEQ